MTLYEQWLKSAYDNNGGAVNTFWNEYMPKEQAVYEKILGEKNNVIKGTVAFLGEKYDFEPHQVCGFIDGINEAIDPKVDVENLEKDTEVEFNIDFTILYKKMVEYKAKHLYELEEWNNIFTEDERKIMFTEQKKSGTIVKGEKVGRNDPCTCGSGLKFKKCCANK
ncbi:MAG: SEC-C metal-binding domain-containing protein [Defluviitaleaceae bacterium]|nr:SEC-C metal-binding domain-containing protein [Defluviitaleaceae bacterium]